MLADGGSLVISAGLLTGTLAIGGFQAAGYGSNHQDLSPKYSGILFGLTNASASSAGALAVFITGTCTKLYTTFHHGLLSPSPTFTACFKYTTVVVGMHSIPVQLELHKLHCVSGLVMRASLEGQTFMMASCYCMPVWRLRGHALISSNTCHILQGLTCMLSCMSCSCNTQTGCHKQDA